MNTNIPIDKFKNNNKIKQYINEYPYIAEITKAFADEDLMGCQDEHYNIDEYLYNAIDFYKKHIECKERHKENIFSFYNLHKEKDIKDYFYILCINTFDPVDCAYFIGTKNIKKLAENIYNLYLAHKF